VIENRTSLASLPTFPDLTRISEEHLEGIRDFTAKFDGYSDFNATSLWSWSASTQLGYLVARLGDHLIVEFGDYLSGDRFLSFLGVEAVDDVATELVAYAGDRGICSILHLVPEVTASRLSRTQWHIEENTDAADYVYDLAQLAVLTGNQYRTSRRFVNRFERMWLPATKVQWVRAHELPHLADDILVLFDSWRSGESQGAGSSAPERSALAHLLRTAATAAPGLAEWSGLCFVDGSLTGAWLVEETSSSSLCAHFQKVANSEAGGDLDTWISVEQARRGRAFGFSELNAEQDLGVEGLRDAKRRLRPTRMLRKYSVSPR
jgi:uncharacterized protein